MIGKCNTLGGTNAYAWIVVTYPAGSICTATNYVTNLRAKDTSGLWVPRIPNRGAFPQIWTVSITNGEKTASRTITISVEGKIEYLHLRYWDGTLFYAGDEYTEHTGGWIPCTDSWIIAAYEKHLGVVGRDIINNGTTLYIQNGNKQCWCNRNTTPVDVTLFSSITIEYVATTKTYSYGQFEIYDATTHDRLGLVNVNNITINSGSTPNVVRRTIDLSNITGEVYVVLGQHSFQDGMGTYYQTIQRIKLEE